MSAGDGDVWTEIQALRRRLDATEAVLAIHEMKARYGDLVDFRFERGRLRDEDDLARIADAIAATFTEDGVWDGGPALGTATGRTEIAARLATSPLTFSRHLFVKPRIQVEDGATRATGRWDILAPCTFADGSTKWMSGVEDDVYACGADGVWRHERMTLTTVFLAPASEGWGRIFT